MGVIFFNYYIWFGRSFVFIIVEYRGRFMVEIKKLMRVIKVLVFLVGLCGRERG